MESRDEIDQALRTAVEHAEEAQGGLMDEPVGSTRSVELAATLVQRVEDVDVLAGDARVATEEAAAADDPASDGS